MYEIDLKKYKKVCSMGKALIVDDSDISADIVKNIMESLHFKTEIARDGKEAVIKYLTSKPHEYSIILMDNIMPFLTGVEAAKIIRICEENTSIPTPIVSISSEMSEENLREYKSAGYNGWLRKPVNKNELVDMVKRVLHGDKSNGDSDQK